MISGKNCDIQDLFDGQSIDWANLDPQSQDLDISDTGQAKPDSLYWPLPPPSKSRDSTLSSPQELGRGMIPSHFEGQSTVPKAGCEQSESNQPILENPRPPSIQQQEQQQRQRFPHSQSHYSESIGSTNPSSQPSLSYSHFIASANSTNSNTGNAGQCISLCTQIISHLDSQISDNNLGLDGVLRISKSCISGLLHITSLESCKIDPNCLLLLCVAVNQMSTLFENNIPATNSRFNSLPVSTLPSLLFGSFQVDHEDQLAFCIRLFSREIQRCRQLLDRISGIHYHHQQQSQKPNDAANSTTCLLQKQWFLASAGRLDSLVAAVTA